MSEPTRDEKVNGHPHATAIGLVDVLYARARDSRGVITEEVLKLLRQAAAIDAGPLVALHTWRIALDVCMTATEDDIEAVTPIAAAIAGGLLRSQQFSEGSVWIASIPVLARLIEVLARCQLFGLAKQALASYRERLNQFAIAHPEGDAYLDSRPDTSLRHAVLSAFDHRDLDLALLCAETGRLKLMTSMLTKANKQTGHEASAALDLGKPASLGYPAVSGGRDTTEPPAGDGAKVSESPSEVEQATSEVGPQDLTHDELLRPYKLSYDEFNDALLAMQDQQEAIDWVLTLTVPWHTMSAVSEAPLRPAEPLAAPDWASWLSEPTLDDLVTTVGPNRILLYPIFDDSWVGVLFVRDDLVHSLKMSNEEIAALAGPDPMSPDGTIEAGEIAALTLVDFMADRAAYLISWCAEDELRFRLFLQGFRRLQYRETNNSAGIRPDPAPPTPPATTEVKASLTYSDAHRADAATERNPTEGIHPVDPAEPAGIPSTHTPNGVPDTPDGTHAKLAGLQVVSTKSLVCPSYRLLGSPERVPIAEPERIIFLGDSLSDLVGPWLEEGAWRQCYRPQIVTHLGADVTKQVLIESFASADLLVLSIHARLDRRRGDPVLETADGTVSFADVLLSAGKVPQQLILSSCSAGRAAHRAPADEVVGLATSLLMRGAARVLAPMVAVDDGLAATVSCLLARQILIEPDLRSAWAPVAAFADASEQIQSQTLGELIGTVEIDPGFPHPRLALDRVLRRPASALHQASAQYVLFGS